MSDSKTISVKLPLSGVLGGGAFWLFTVGFAKLSFWQGVVALLLWPYYLGAALH